MSVYRPKTGGKQAKEYKYDFWVAGRRFSGGTGCTHRDKAERFEEAERQRIKAELAEQAKRRAAPMTINAAASRFWSETSRFYRGGAGATFDASLAWIVRELEPDTLLREITNSKVAELVGRRRGEGVKPATVNRTVTEPLRRILRRASAAWDQDVQPIDWGKHMLEEPRERVREATFEEEERIIAALPEDYRPIVNFALLSGARLAECVHLQWNDVDWGGRRITLRGKGGHVDAIPMTVDIRELLWPLVGRHESAVFCYRAVRQVLRGAGARQKGAWYPVTYEGTKTAWARAIARSGVKDFRFHDTRHTAASRLLRTSGNLKAVQKMLRHQDIGTTVRYAHVNDDDLREAMEQMNCRRPASPQSRKVS